MEFLAKGKRGKVYLTKTGTVIKKAPAWRIHNEIIWLKKLNSQGIGPKLISFNAEGFEMEYLQGPLLKNYLETSSHKKSLAAIKNCLQQCRVMDKLHVNKKEMHHPDKHILMIKDKPVFIDFERCKITEHPKNVTQFVEYLAKLGFMDRKNVELLLKDYKKNQTEKNFKKIFSLFS